MTNLLASIVSGTAKALPEDEYTRLSVMHYAAVVRLMCNIAVTLSISWPLRLN